MEEPAEEWPASIEEMFADWPPEVAEVFIAHNDFGAIRAVQESLYKYPTTIADLQGARHPTLSYYGADDTFIELARRQAEKLPCVFRAVPGDHFMTFAQAANILPAAIAHFEAVAAETMVSSHGAGSEGPE